MTDNANNNPTQAACDARAAAITKAIKASRKPIGKREANLIRGLLTPRT
jgi:hypothetical protein